MTALATAAATAPTYRPTDRQILSRRLRRWTAIWAFTGFAIVVISAFLMPLAYMTSTALKSADQMSASGAPLWPAVPETFSYEGKPYPIYEVPTADGIRHWALVEPSREDSGFVDPANPGAGIIQWHGRWRTLAQSWQFSLNLNNFATAWNTIDFSRLLFNTVAIAGIGTLGTLVSSICVAYGFSRFRIPGKNGLFLLLLSTIILPFQVTLIPTFALFSALHWTGTWLPLLVPHFFANAYNVFLLRQFFNTIPRDLDEAAMIDGASPLRILVSVILPQSIPAVIAVGLFHFFWAWNDYFLPLIYLQGNTALQPISVGIANFNALFSQKPTLIEASAIMALAVPVLIFFLAQRAFMRGIVVTGVEK
jgi:multiple sugar transport system permease protein